MQNVIGGAVFGAGWDVAGWPFEVAVALALATLFACPVTGAGQLVSLARTGVNATKEPIGISNCGLLGLTVMRSD